MLPEDQQGDAGARGEELRRRERPGVVVPSRPRGLLRQLQELRPAEEVHRRRQGVLFHLEHR